MMLENKCALLLKNGRAAEVEQILKGSQSLHDSENLTHLLSVALFQQEKFVDGLTAAKRAMTLNPNNVKNYVNIGKAMANLKQTQSAERFLLFAIKKDGNDSEALQALGDLYALDEQWSKAREFYKRAFRMLPDHAGLVANLGTAECELGNYWSAESLYLDALHRGIFSAQIYNNLANVQSKLGRLESALVHYNSALDCGGCSADVLANRGTLLCDMKCFAQALMDTEAAIAIEPAVAQAWTTRGTVYKALKNEKKSLESYARAYELSGQSNSLACARLLGAKLRNCDWLDLDLLTKQYLAFITSGQSVGSPFTTLTISDDPVIQKMAAELYSSTLLVPRTTPSLERSVENARLRIGYFSADFHEHATSQLMAEMLENHDRCKFEVFLFSFGPVTGDPMQLRIRSACEHFVDVSGSASEEIISIVRAERIQIAVDLKGYTLDSKPSIFLGRCAPIQVNYLGYPGTMGNESYDYILGDNVVTPEGSDQYYSEKVIRLPFSYQCNDSTKCIDDQILSRSDLGLPEGSFVYASFNSNHKILPEMFETWLSILSQTAKSILWLYIRNDEAKNNLLECAERHGVDPSRLYFCSWAPLPRHLNRIRHCDLILDTWPYGAHTTASDALWAGTPILTLEGLSFPSRVCSSLLRALDLDELVARSLPEYQDLAIKLRESEAYLNSLRERVLVARANENVWNGKRFAQKLEAVFEQMVLKAS